VGIESEGRGGGHWSCSGGLRWVVEIDCSCRITGGAGYGLQKRQIAPPMVARSWWLRGGSLLQQWCAEGGTNRNIGTRLPRACSVMLA
jgi:hypothetical protein